MKIVSEGFLNDENIVEYTFIHFTFLFFTAKKYISTINPFFVLVKSTKFGGMPMEKRSTPTPTLLAAM